MAWRESEHPRDADGKFTDGNGTGVKGGFDDSVKNGVKQGFDGTIHPGLGEKPRFKIGLDFFAEKALENQSEEQIRKGIRSTYKKIAAHEAKIANPEIVKGWNECSDAKKAGTLNHWKKELKIFKDNIANREEELRRRKRNENK